MNTWSVHQPQIFGLCRVLSKLQTCVMPTNDKKYGVEIAAQLSPVWLSMLMPRSPR